MAISKEIRVKPIELSESERNQLLKIRGDNQPDTEEGVAQPFNLLEGSML